MKKQKISSGELANIGNINKKTLFYYDQIDLLKPAIVEANGYRYYTFNQIDQLSKIKALQSVGFSLGEIKQQLDVNDLSEGLAILRRQKQTIEKKANELLAVKKMLDQKIFELEHYEQTGIQRVFLRDYDEAWLRVDEPSSQTGYITNYLLDGYHFGVILANAVYSTEQLKITKYQQVANIEMANYTKEKGEYAGIYFTSDENNIIANALNALAIIKSRGYSVDGRAYLKDIASDFVNFQNERIPFQLTMKVSNSLMDLEESIIS